MERCHHVNNQVRGQLLFEYPVVQSWASNASFLEKVEVEESRDLAREKRCNMQLGKALDNLSAKRPKRNLYLPQGAIADRYPGR
jgi:hypothetical protein